MGEIWCKEWQGEAQQGRGGGETVLGVKTSKQSMVEFTGKAGSQTKNKYYTNTNTEFRHGTEESIQNCVIVPRYTDPLLKED